MTDFALRVGDWVEVTEEAPYGITTPGTIGEIVEIHPMYGPRVRVDVNTVDQQYRSIAEADKHYFLDPYYLRLYSTDPAVIEKRRKEDEIRKNDPILWKILELQRRQTFYKTHKDTLPSWS